MTVRSGLAASHDGLALVECLNKARTAYDARRVREDAEERAREAERERLPPSPEARRAHLQEHRLRFHDVCGGVASDTPTHVR